MERADAGPAQLRGVGRHRSRAAATWAAGPPVGNPCAAGRRTLVRFIRRHQQRTIDTVGCNERGPGDGNADRVPQRGRRCRPAQRSSPAARRMASARRGAAPRVLARNARRRRPRRLWRSTPTPAARCLCSTSTFRRPISARPQESSWPLPSNPGCPRTASCYRCPETRSTNSGCSIDTGLCPGPGRRRGVLDPQIQPELQGLRRWLCHEVRAQARGEPATGWSYDADAALPPVLPAVSWQDHVADRIPRHSSQPTTLTGSSR